MPGDRFDLRVLGALQLADPTGRDVEPVLAQSRRAALLVYLALARPRGPQRRDVLLAVLPARLQVRHVLEQTLLRWRRRRYMPHRRRAEHLPLRRELA